MHSRKSDFTRPYLALLVTPISIQWVPSFSPRKEQLTLHGHTSLADQVLCRDQFSTMAIIHRHTGSCIHTSLSILTLKNQHSAASLGNLQNPGRPRSSSDVYRYFYLRQTSASRSEKAKNDLLTSASWHVWTKTPALVAERRKFHYSPSPVPAVSHRVPPPRPTGQPLIRLRGDQTPLTNPAGRPFCSFSKLN